MKAGDLYDKLTEICTQMAQGDYEKAKAIFDLLPCDDVEDPINILVEAFAMMSIRIEAREFELSRLLTELEAARAELLRHQDRLIAENSQLRVELEKKNSKESSLMHLTQAPAMVEVMRQADRAASVDCTLLFSGETGTGKSIFAKYIHTMSDRAQKPFVAINCAAIPATLLESELFGIEMGVASGVKARMGRFEQASGGTIFLDEIGDMPLESQAKLLHVVESGVVERIGGRKPKHVDVRIMAATLRDLEQCVKERTFREDLYYRLNVMKIHIPPLRDRREDIPLFIKHMLARFAQRNPRAVSQISHEAIQKLQQYMWPGNVRELENELERAMLLATGDCIMPQDLSLTVDKLLTHMPVQAAACTSAVVHDFEQGIPTLQSVEHQHILDVMQFLQGNKSRAARALGISREGLRVKLERMK